MTMKAVKLTDLRTNLSIEIEPDSVYFMLSIDYDNFAVLKLTPAAEELIHAYASTTIATRYEDGTTAYYLKESRARIEVQTGSEIIARFRKGEAIERRKAEEARPPLTVVQNDKLDEAAKALDSFNG